MSVDFTRSTNIKSRFKLFVEQVLGPTLLEGDVVVMDNLAAHNLAAHKVVGISHGY